MGLPFVADPKSLDPSLTSLFNSSAGPITIPSKARKGRTVHDDPENGAVSGTASDDHLNSGVGIDLEGNNNLEDAQLREDSIDKASAPSLSTKGKRKRKRAIEGEELEEAYLRKLARQEAREGPKKHVAEGSNTQETAENMSSGSDEDERAPVGNVEEDEDDPSSFPKHETMTPGHNDAELDKAARTVFLGNVSTSAITSKSSKRVLLNHLSSFLPALPAETPPHKIGSIRFRSTAYSSKIPKRGAFAKKELMDATTKSTHAYVVYSTKLAAREAVKQLNGTVVLDRHLRVDQVAHPAKADQRRCVFVGNLEFVDDESNIEGDEDPEKKRKKSKSKVPSDIEEGLWRQFGKAGTVENVRVVRDAATRFGKGFAYVQFTDENAVEAALLFNDKKFPPLLPRKLRVMRAKGMKRKATRASKGNQLGLSSGGAKAMDPSIQGRAKKLLGRAGAALARNGQKHDASEGKGRQLPIKPPESFVFEGHRASIKEGKGSLRLGGTGKKKSGKPRTRSSKRGAAWKAAGGRKLAK